MVSWQGFSAQMMEKMMWTNKSKFVLTIFILSAVGIFSSCSDDGSDQESEFDRARLLTSLADDLIIPNLRQAQGSVEALESSALEFTDAATEANLTLLREAWVAAVVDFQHTSAYGFGPGNFISRI